MQSPFGKNLSFRQKSLFAGFTSSRTPPSRSPSRRCCRSESPVPESSACARCRCQAHLTIVYSLLAVFGDGFQMVNRLPRGLRHHRPSSLRFRWPASAVQLICGSKRRIRCRRFRSCRHPPARRPRCRAYPHPARQTLSVSFA